MSTSETITVNMCPCPCGNGHVVNHITTQDNPWSSADFRYEIQCSPCASKWRIEGSNLILRASEAPYIQAMSVEAAAYKKLKVLVDDLVNEYFENFSAASKKAELSEMQRLKISNMSYKNFLKGKSDGLKPANLASGLRNEVWLRKLAQDKKVEQPLLVLIAEWKAAQEACQLAGSQITRQRITKN